MKRRVIEDINEIQEQERKQYKIRTTPVTTKNIGNKNPLTTMTNLILLWPPKDLRLDKYYHRSHIIKSTDDEIMIDLTDGMHLELKSKNFKTGTAKFHLMTPANLDEFERYNLTIFNHNKKWKEMGSPEDVFDPIHGNISKIKDTYVDPAIISSRHNVYPDSINENRSYGTLAKARPDLKRVPILEIIYHLSPLKKGWKIGYVVKNLEGQILYYNHLYHDDMTVIIRQSVQEIWGHPYIYGTTGPFLDGISLLIQGKKIAICDRENDKPPIMKSTDTVKKKNTDLVYTEIEEKALRSGSTLMRYIIPLILTIALIIHISRCLIASFGSPYGPEYNRDTSGEFIVGLIILVAISLLSQIIAKKIHRQSSALNIKKRFM